MQGEWEEQKSADQLADELKCLLASACRVMEQKGIIRSFPLDVRVWWERYKQEEARWTNRTR